MVAPLRNAIIGNELQMDLAFKWLRTYYPGRSAGTLVLTGGAGCGKTLLWSSMCRACNYERVEISGMSHNEDTVSYALQNCTGMQRTISGKILRYAIVIDDVDTLFTGRSLFKATREIMRDCDLPKIIVSNYKKCRALNEFLDGLDASKLLRIHFDSVLPDVIAAYLRQVQKNEFIGTAPSFCDRIADRCHGDIRHALIMIRTCRTIGDITRSFKDVRLSTRGVSLAQGIFDGLAPSLSRVAYACSLENMVLGVWGIPSGVGTSYLTEMKKLTLDQMCEIADGFTDRDVLAKGRQLVAPGTCELSEHIIACSIWKAGVVYRPYSLRWTRGADARFAQRKQYKRRRKRKHDTTQRSMYDFFNKTNV